MDVLAAIIGWALFGLIAGAIARLLVPGRQPMGLLTTMILGIIGSLAGGFIAYLFMGGDPMQPSGWIMSILGAIVVLLLYVSLTRRRTA